MDTMKKVGASEEWEQHLLKEIEIFKRKQIDFDKNADKLNSLYRHHIIDINENSIASESIDHTDNNK